MNLELYKLKNLIMEMSLMGAAQMLKMTSPASDNLSQREAYQAFGKGRVKRWVSTGMIGKMRSGSTIRSKFHYLSNKLLPAI
ncbi:MAG: hypothetical protein WCZ43_06170 [Proteiniphilum sp.]